MNKALIFLTLLLLVLTGCSFFITIKDPVVDAGNPTVEQIRTYIQNNKVYDDVRGYWYVEATPAQLKQAAQTLEFNGVNLSTIPIDWYYHRPSERLYLNVDKTELKEYIVEFKSNRKLVQTKNNKEIFTIESSADMEQVGLFQETGEFGIHSDEWETINYTGNLVVKGRKVCNAESFYSYGYGLGKVSGYTDCWDNPEKIDNMTNESLAYFETVSDSLVVLKTFGDYDPLSGDYTSGLVGCYDFDSDFSDYTANLGTFTGGNSPTISTSFKKVGGGSLNLTGSSQYLYNVDISSDITSYPFTIGGWMHKTSYSGNYHTFVLDGSGFNKVMALLGFGRQGRIQSVNIVATTPTTVFSDNNWEFIVGVFNSSQMRLYVDGVNVVNGSVGTFTSDYATLTIGRYSDGLSANYLSGFADEFFTYNVELTDSQILELYNSGTGYSCADIVASGGANDTCTYSSGDWNVLCSDNCVISSLVDLGANNLIISGTGSFTANAAITTTGYIAAQCQAGFSG